MFILAFSTPALIFPIFDKTQTFPAREIVKQGRRRSAVWDILAHLDILTRHSEGDQTKRLKFTLQIIELIMHYKELAK